MFQKGYTLLQEFAVKRGFPSLVCQHACTVILCAASLVLPDTRSLFQRWSASPFGQDPSAWLFAQPLDNFCASPVA